MEINNTADGAEFVARMTIIPAQDRTPLLLRQRRKAQHDHSDGGRRRLRVARIHSAFVDRVEGFRTIGVAANGAEALAMARRLVPT